MKEQILMPCWAKDLKKGMIISSSISDNGILTVEYSTSASYDFTWVKFKEHESKTLQNATERFEVLVDEEEIDRQRNEYGGVPMWCINSVGKMKYDWIEKIKN